jgi:hypothetical protein
MNRRNQLLTAVLAIQVVIGIVVFWPRPATSGAAGPLLANYKAAEVVSLAVADESGHQVELSKPGDAWVVSQADAYPADASKITPFLTKLENLRTNRLVTQTEASHKQLKVADTDFTRKVDVKLADGSSHTVYVGSSAGAGATHVRADGQPQVYLTADLNSWEVDARATSWINTEWFTVTQTATVGIALQNAQGSFEFTKGGDAWTMQGLTATETLNQNNLTSLLAQGSSLRIVAPLGKTEQDSYGLKAPLAVVTFTTKDDTGEPTHTFRFGAKQQEPNRPDGSPGLTYYVASSSDSPYYVRVADYTANPFVSQTRNDFVQAPPMPAASPVAPVSPPATPAAP